jgi:aryl-alcohol dehydrogenase-like predicted oxidoreductase
MTSFTAGGYIKADVLSSMKNLKTDYLDLFAFHGVNSPGR